MREPCTPLPRLTYVLLYTLLRYHVPMQMYVFFYIVSHELRYFLQMLRNYVFCRKILAKIEKKNLRKKSYKKFPSFSQVMPIKIRSVTYVAIHGLKLCHLHGPLIVICPDHVLPLLVRKWGFLAKTKKQQSLETHMHYQGLKNAQSH